MAEGGGLVSRNSSRGLQPALRGKLSLPLKTYLYSLIIVAIVLFILFFFFTLHSPFYSSISETARFAAPPPTPTRNSAARTLPTYSGEIEAKLASSFIQQGKIFFKTTSTTNDKADLNGRIPPIYLTKMELLS